MSLILQRYARFGNCLKCHLTFSRQIEVRRFLSCSRLLRNQPNKEVAPSAENVDGQLQTSFAKKGMYVNGLHIWKRNVLSRPSRDTSTVVPRYLHT